jgi:hypothetical protein
MTFNYLFYAQTMLASLKQIEPKEILVWIFKTLKV